MATSTLGSGTLVLAGTTSGTTTVTATAVAGTTTLTLPAATDTLVGKATTDTLTNKTLTGAAMNGTVGATTPSTGAFTTLSSSGLATLASSQITGATFPASGSGLEVIFQSGTSKLQSFNRTGSTYLPLTIDGTTVGVLSSGATIGAFSSTGLAVTGLTDISAATSGQIKFPATQNASTNANTLDDYEEGTWTATMVPSTSGTITLSNNGGTYTKIGRAVTINAALKVSSVSSPVGYFTINGLPFSGGAGVTFRCSISILGDAMETTMTTSITASMQSGTVLYVFKYSGTGSQANCAQDVKANSEFFIGGTYITD